MANIDTDSAIDWTLCELIECVPGKVSGRPVVRGTRIMPEAIAGGYDLGETIPELHAGFPTLTLAQIERLGPLFEVALGRFGGLRPGRPRDQEDEHESSSRTCFDPIRAGQVGLLLVEEVVPI